MTPAERARNIYDNNIQSIKTAAQAQMLTAYPSIINDIEDRARNGHKQYRFITNESIHFVVALQTKLKADGFIISRNGTTQPDKNFLITW
jgi:hypothetical protein